MATTNPPHPTVGLKALQFAQSIQYRNMIAAAAAEKAKTHDVMLSVSDAKNVTKPATKRQKTEETKDSKGSEIFDSSEEEKSSKEDGRDRSPECEDDFSTSDDEGDDDGSGDQQRQESAKQS